MERARRTLREARAAIKALRLPVAEQDDLTDTLSREVEHFAASSSANHTFETQTDSLEIPAETASEILRILQESLTNVARHAQANNVIVRLDGNDDGFTLTVQDDGVGFDLQAGLERPDCYGLTGMRERAQRMGGVLDIESVPGTGTIVTVSIGDAADQDQSVRRCGQTSQTHSSPGIKVSA
jgi:signal transduction histidine kinase